MAEAGSFANRVKQQADIVCLAFRGFRLGIFFKAVLVITLNFCLVFLLLKVPTVSRAQESRGQFARGRSFPLPSGKFTPIEIEACSLGDAILFWEKADGSREMYTLYSLSLTSGDVKKVLDGKYGRIHPSPVSHLFVIDQGDGNDKRLTIIDDRGRIMGSLKHINDGTSFPIWSPDGKFIVYERNRPGLTPDSDDFDPDGFTAFGVLDVSRLEDTWFPVRPTAFSHFFLSSNPNPQYICASRSRHEDPDRVQFSIYDLLTRKSIEVDPQLLKECRTQNRRYYVSSQLESPMAFRIYSSQTGRVVRQFPGVDPATKESLLAGTWNPKNDDLLIVERRAGMNEMKGIDLYRVSDGKTLKTFRGRAFSWTPDGSSVIVFSDGEFHFEPVPHNNVK